MMDKIKEPSKKRPGSSRLPAGSLNDTAGSLNDISGSYGGHLNIQNKHSDNNTQSRRVKRTRKQASVQADNLDEIIQNAEDKNRAAIKTSATKGKAKTFPTIHNATSMWKEAFEEAFGFLPDDHFTIDEWGIFKRNTMQSPITNVGEFFADVCNNWGDIIDGYLSWASNLREIPTTRDVVMLVRHLRTAIRKHKVMLTKEDEKLTPKVEPPVLSIDFAALESEVTTVGVYRDGVIIDTIEMPSTSPITPNVRTQHVFFDTDTPDAGNITIGDYQLRAASDILYELYVYMGRRRGWQTTFDTLRVVDVVGKTSEQLIEIIEDI